MIIIKRKQGVVFSFRLFISFFLAVLGPGCRAASPPAAASRGSCRLWCTDLSLRRLLLLRSTWTSAAAAPGPWSTDPVVVAHGLNCSSVCGTFPDQGLNLCLLLWQADSLPLSHHGSPKGWFFSPSQVEQAR